MMFIRTIKTQLIFILRQKTTQLIFFVLLGFVGYNFVNNVLQFRGTDVSNMYHPMKLLTLSYNRVYYNADITLLFVQIYPLLVACPAGLILAKERQMKISLLIESRVGRTAYQYSKAIAVFIASGLVFTVPFLIEVFLNAIAFPMEATKDFSHRGIYSASYIQMVKNYWFSGLYNFSPYLYAAVNTILFGAFSGLLGSMVMSFSSICPVRFRGMYLILPFVLLNGTVYILPEYTGGTLQHVWYKYILIFADEEKEALVFVAIVVIIFMLTVLMNVIRGKKDSL